MPEMATGHRMADGSGASDASIAAGGKWASTRMPGGVENEPPPMANDAAPKLGPKLVKRGRTKEDYVYEQRTFRSTITNRRITVLMEGPRFDSMGRRHEGENKYVQFREGIYRTSDPECIKAIERNNDYGISIWDVDAMAEAAKAASVRTVKKSVIEDEEMLDALVADPNFLKKLDEAMKAQKKKASSKD